MKLKAVQNGRVTVCTTYMDEDGDEITISSDEELLDAFEQFVHATPPVVRAKAVVVRKKGGGGGGGGGNKQQQRDREETHDNTECDRNLTNEKVVPVEEAEEESKSKVSEVSEVSDTKENKKDVEVKEEQFPGLDCNFIHGRHTCDGCLSTPIFGIRYHAINLPDYDLCSGCYANYKGTGAVFKPVQLDRDRHLQSRWQRRFMRHCHRRAAHPYRFHNGTKKPMMDDDDGKNVDLALKEAIRRSLLDAYPQVKKGESSSKTIIDNEAATVDETVPLIPSTEQKNEPDVEVAPQVVLPMFVEVSAGNEHTQKVLDSMDLELKESLSRSLSKCFSGSSINNSTNESTTPQSSKNDNEKSVVELTPIADTHEKITLMDETTKAEIRRTLTEFFANRSGPNTEADSNEYEVNAKARIHRGLAEFFAKRYQSVGNGCVESREAIHRELDEFFAQRSKANSVDGSNGGDDSSEVKNNIETLVVDIVMDNDGLSGVTENDKVSNVGDDDNNEDTESNISEGSVVKDEWQMVVEDDEMIAVAAQMLGSALFQSDSNLSLDDSKRNDA